MHIRRIHHPVTGRLYWGLCNTNGDDIAQLATTFSANEMTFFKRLVSINSIE